MNHTAIEQKPLKDYQPAQMGTRSVTFRIFMHSLYVMVGIPAAILTCFALFGMGLFRLFTAMR